MCCSIGGTVAKFTGTKIYAGEAFVQNKYAHLLAYQNHASTEPGSPNAMVLPFPTSQPMTQANAIDTSKFKSFLDNITDATKIQRRSFSKTLGVAAYGSDSFKLAEVFDVGSYTVVLAEHVKQIPEALNRVPFNKRPKVSARFLMGYGNLYPKQPIALCCWEGGEVEAEPLLWWYEPSDPNHLFIPTMDAHDGGPPDLKAEVNADHIISVGSAIHPNGNPVTYKDDVTRDLGYLPSRVHGHRVPYRVKNGDTFVSIANLRNPGGQSVMIKRGANINLIDSQYNMNGWHA